jgi:hypothetical protein
MSTTTDYEDTTPAKANGEVPLNRSKIDDLLDVTPQPAEVTDQRVEDLFNENLVIDDEDDFSALGGADGPSPIIVGKPDKLKHYQFRADLVVDRFVLPVPDGMDETTYLVTDSIVDSYPDLVKRARLYAYISKKGAIRLWRVPRSKRNDRYFNSVTLVAKAGQEQWVRTWWEPETSSYRYKAQTAGVRPEPKWGDITMSEILRAAFMGEENLVITDTEHEIFQQINEGDD